VAKIARELGALTIGVVTRPFLFEGKKRKKHADLGVNELRENVDTLIVIPNQKLLGVASEKTPLLETFKRADEVLLQAVKGISDLINIRGLINLDFADIRTVMQSKGMAIMGTGVASGENRAVEAASQAISSPLLENVSIEGATGIIINVTGGPDLTLWEVNEASTLITEAAHEDAEVIFGAVINSEMSNEIHVTVIATGFQDQATDHVSDQIQRMQALAQAQLDSLAQSEVYKNFMNNPSAATSRMTPSPLERPIGEKLSPLSAEGQAQIQAQAALQAELPIARQPQQFNLQQQASAAGQEKSLPRDILMAKARAFREAQHQGQPAIEQLSMQLHDENELNRRAQDAAKSPFDSDNLDVPSFLRRQAESDRTI
jgi:cell division protein FtsZ